MPLFKNELLSVKFWYGGRGIQGWIKLPSGNSLKSLFIFPTPCGRSTVFITCYFIGILAKIFNWKGNHPAGQYARCRGTGDMRIDLRDKNRTLTADVAPVGGAAEEGPSDGLWDQKILPAGYLIELINRKEIDAKLTDGALRLSLPEVEKATPRKITVQMGLKDWGAGKSVQHKFAGFRLL